MGEAGFFEFLLIGIIAIMVIGPDQLPKVAKTTGKWFGKLRRTVSGIQQEINQELKNEELLKLIEKSKEEAKSLEKEIKKKTEE